MTRVRCHLARCHASCARGRCGAATRQGGWRPRGCGVGAATRWGSDHRTAMPYGRIVMRPTAIAVTARMLTVWSVDACGRHCPHTPERLSLCHPERPSREGSLRASGETMLAGGSAPALRSRRPAGPSRHPLFRNDARSVPSGPVPCLVRARSLRRRDAAGWVAATRLWGWCRDAVGFGSPHRHAVWAHRDAPHCHRRDGAYAYCVVGGCMRAALPC